MNIQFHAEVEVSMVKMCLVVSQIWAYDGFDLSYVGAGLQALLSFGYLRAILLPRGTPFCVISTH